MSKQYVVTVSVQVIASGSTLRDIWHSQIAPPLFQKIKVTLTDMQISVREDVGDFFGCSNLSVMNINGLDAQTILSSTCSLVCIPADDISYTGQEFDQRLRNAVLNQLKGINPVVSISFYAI